MKKETTGKNYSFLEKHIYHLPKDEYRLKAMNEFALKKLQPKGTVLDWGTGAGYLIEEMISQNYAKDINGLDISPLLLPYLKNKFEDHNNVKIIDGSMEKLQQNKYDTIYTLDVLEHTENDTENLQCLYSSLKTGGKLFINIPAHQKLYNDFDKKLGHYRRYSKNELLEKMKQTGFSVEHIGYWNSLGYFIVKLATIFPFIPRPQSIYQRTTSVQEVSNSFLAWWFHVIENNIPSPIGLSIYVIAKK